MPSLSPSVEDRNRVFQTLKPPCIAVSQAALALNTQQGDAQSVTNAVEQLQKALSTVTAKANSLDANLADYVFFPLSQVLKISQKLSLRCLELTLQCLAILIKQGWQSRVQPQLAAQIVILCTLLAEQNPKGLASSESTDELRASAFSCLQNLFLVLSTTSESGKALASEANFPQLGQTITTILDGILIGDSVEVQRSAISALQALMRRIATRDVQAGFLPGIVSKLTKVLTVKTNHRRNHIVLIGALDVICFLFRNTLVLYPIETSCVQDERRIPEGSGASKIIDQKWLETAAAQLKPAITTIARLKAHSRADVREALGRLCIVILDQCHTVLLNCSSIAIDTLLALTASDSATAIEADFRSLVNDAPRISNLLTESIYDRIRSLPTVMQSADEEAKVQSMAQISAAYGMISAVKDDTSAIDSLLVGGLRDSVVITIQAPSKAQQTLHVMSPVQSIELAVLNSNAGSQEFSSPLVKYKGQEGVLDSINDLACLIARSGSEAFADNLIRDLRQSQGELQIANMSLLIDVVETKLRNKHGIEAFFNDDGHGSTVFNGHLDELYALSLSVLNRASEEGVDIRLQALALRAIALRAEISGQDFRDELIDALYPVLFTLATPSEQLQRDSITTLNVLTDACEYGSVKDLIVENIDYLTNAVALQLDAFGISPQAPQVLLMMVRLAGPSLLPFLEDTVDSIFAALENYHGYGLLVELLFKVLSVVAEEGAKAPQLAITQGFQSSRTTSKYDHWTPTDVPDLEALLRQQAQDDAWTASTEREPHPERPWKGIDELDGPTEENSQEDEDSQARLPDEVDVPPPAPKTYNLLFKITELTQHFLASASPSLRGSLLSLISTTTPAIAKHENSFLPLINTLWPEIVSRLDDQEPHVVASALDIIAVLCENAGDFMRSRIVKIWPGLVGIHEKVAKEVIQSNRPSTLANSKARHEGSQTLVIRSSALDLAIRKMRSAPADYTDTSSRMIWDSLTHALTTAVHHISLPPEMFDEVLEMLQPVLEEVDVRSALEKENADAVWLARVRSGAIACPQTPAEGSRWGFVIVAA